MSIFAKHPLNFNKIDMHSVEGNFMKNLLNLGKTNLHFTNIKTSPPCFQQSCWPERRMDKIIGGSLDNVVPLHASIQNICGRQSQPDEVVNRPNAKPVCSKRPKLQCTSSPRIRKLGGPDVFSGIAKRRTIGQLRAHLTSPCSPRKTQRELLTLALQVN